MAKLGVIICYLFLVISYTPLTVFGFEPISLSTAAALTGIASGLVSIANTGSNLIKNSIRYLKDNPDTDGVSYTKHFNKDHDQLLDHLRSLAKAKYEIKTDISNMRDDILNQMFQNLPGLVELNRRLSKVFKNCDHVDGFYEKFINYYENPGKYNRNKIIDFANSMTSDNKLGLSYLLSETHKFFVQSYSVVPSSLTLLSHHIETFLKSSQISKSPQQLIYEILLNVMYTEVKGLLTIRYSFEILEFYDQGNFTAHIDKETIDFAKRLNSTLSVFQQVMSTTSRELSRNNPPQHIEGETYEELKNVFQEFVINEKDINNDHDCSESCADYKNPFRKNTRSCSYPGESCAVTHCDGTLHDCKYKVDSDMELCISRQNSNRHYDFIDYNDGLRYGSTQGKCTTASLKSTSHFEFFKWWCDPCFCVCADTTTQSERYFNLDPVMTNRTENYVITGARLVKRKNMIHIQIREGQLLPNGRINASTLRWSKINENPTKYYTLQWQEGREIHLDDLNVPKNYVLTGLSFASDISDSKSYTYRLHLKGFAAPLYFYDGILNLKHEQDFTNYDLFSTKEINIENRDIPTRTSTPTNLRSNNNEYVKFRPSSLEKDVGQSTIPFIETQTVTTDPAVPMTSAGLFLRSRSDSGGFISIKLYSYDYSQHVKPNLLINYNNLSNENFK